MNREGLSKFFREKTTLMIETMEAKNADYAGLEKGDQSPFSNFETVELLGISTTEQGFLTRMTDKFCRIINLRKQVAQVKDETIQDTLIDLANYCLLLAAFIESKKLKVRA